LKGRYIFADAGTILPPAFGVNTPTLGADAGFEEFNGDGTGSIAVHVPGGGGPTFDIFVIFVASNGEALLEHCTRSRQLSITHRAAGAARD
jgi:hypothetical protein